jgi:hypothetical protein
VHDQHTVGSTITTGSSSTGTGTGRRGRSRGLRTVTASCRKAKVSPPWANTVGVAGADAPGLHKLPAGLSTRVLDFLHEEVDDDGFYLFWVRRCAGLVEGVPTPLDHHQRDRDTFGLQCAGELF